MPITVNTNMSSLICQRSLGKATNGMNTALQRMSTGLRINSSKDDAAGMAISSKMDTKLSSYSVAQDNVQMGQSMLDTASGSIDTMTSMLQRMRDLSEQAANGTYGAEERKAMQAEVDALTSEIYRIKNTTEFNGKKILGEEEQKYTTPTISMRDITDLAVVNTSEVIGISSAEELVKLAEFTNNGSFVTKDRTFVLTGDIDLSSIDNWNAIGIGSGTDDSKFQGIFDGNNYTISNLSIDKDTSGEGILAAQGLFGKIKNATICNVNLDNINVTSKVNTAAFAGLVENSTIENCNAKNVKINGTKYVGGLIAQAYDSKVLNCSTSGSVNGTDPSNSSAGGLVGLAYNRCVISNSYSTCDVSGEINVGGLVGRHANLKADQDINTKSTISNCWSSGNVTGTTNVGEFVGYNRTSDILSSSYKNISNTLNPIGLTEDNVACKIELVTSKLNPLENTKIINNVNLQVGINSDKNSKISIDTGFEMGNFKIDLRSENGARRAINSIDAMMETVSKKSLDLGATQNRLDSIKEFQSVQMSALTSSSSLIKDADIAKESASYIKNQILQQTTATLLATANQNPSIALSLI